MQVKPDEKPENMRGGTKGGLKCFQIRMKRVIMMKSEYGSSSEKVLSQYNKRAKDGQNMKLSAKKREN